MLLFPTEIQTEKCTVKYMTFTILYEQQSSRKVTISSTSSKFNSHHSKKHHGFKSEMGH